MGIRCVSASLSIRQSTGVLLVAFGLLHCSSDDSSSREGGPSGASGSASESTGGASGSAGESTGGASGSVGENTAGASGSASESTGGASGSAGETTGAGTGGVSGSAGETTGAGTGGVSGSAGETTGAGTGGSAGTGTSGSSGTGTGGGGVGGAGTSGTGGSSGTAPVYDCDSYCAAAESKCALDQAGVEACTADCETMNSGYCGESYWTSVIQCGSDEAAWTCDEGNAVLTGCQDERNYYTMCMDSELCAAACEAPTTKCSLDSSVESACISDCNLRLYQITNSYPDCKGLAVEGWLCAADPDAWTCDGTTSATRTGCTEEADALDDCLTNGLNPTSTVTCGSYRPCCELCDTQCTGSSGTHLESYRQCLLDCMFCCEPCDI